MKRVNLFTADTELDADDPDGFKAGMLRFGPSLDAALIGGTIYDLPPGQSNCPYHYEYEEEWLLVVDGTVVVRAPDGEHTLERGDVACFPPGPAGAHYVRNDGESTARVAMFSSTSAAGAVVYPDSDMVWMWTDDDAVDLIVERSSAVDDAAPWTTAKSKEA